MFDETCDVLSPFLHVNWLIVDWICYKRKRKKRNRYIPKYTEQKRSYQWFSKSRANVIHRVELSFKNFGRGTFRVIFNWTRELLDPFPILNRLIVDRIFNGWDGNERVIYHGYQSRSDLTNGGNAIQRVELSFRNFVRGTFRVMTRDI